MNSGKPQSGGLPAPFFADSEHFEDDQRLDLLRYWRVLLKYRWGILSLALAAGILAAVYAFSLEPRYQASATLLFEPKTSRYAPIQDVVAAEIYQVYRAQQYFETQQAIMRSRNFAEKVVDTLELGSHPYFDPALRQPSRARLQIDWRAWLPDWIPWLLPESPLQAELPSPSARREAAIAAIQQGLSVAPVHDTMLMEIGFQSRDPEFAAEMANAVADLFIDYDLESRLDTLRKATAWLTERTAGLRESLQDSELDLQQFREQQELFNLEGGSSILGRQVEDAFTRLTETRNERLRLESLYRDIERLRNSSPLEAANHPTLLKYDGVRAAKTLEAEVQQEIAQLNKRYGPRHPKMLHAQAELEGAQSQLSKEVAIVLQGAAKEYDSVRKREAGLEREFNRLKQEAQEADRKMSRLRTLERGVDADRELYDLFLTRFKETNFATDVDTPNARIIDQALVPGAPVWPNPQRIVLITVLGALFAGIMLALLVEYLDNTLKNSEDVEEKLGLPLLGSLHLMRRRRGKSPTPPERMFLEDGKSNFAEAIRTIRTGVVLSGLDNPHKIVAVTSTLPGEGKTTVSINLAIALGQLEKVLLIDADMRRASIGPLFGFDKSKPGLSELVAGSKETAQCIHHLDAANLDVLPAGTIPPNPQELLSSQRFKELLLRLSEHYQRIVVDTAPTQMVSDPMLVASQASAILYVVRADATPYQLALGGIRRLRQVSAPLVGVVLNQVNLRKTGRYPGYGRYGRYGRYGGYPSSDHYGPYANNT